MNDAAISTPDLSDRAAQARALEVQWRSYGARTAFSGQAVTIKCFEDNSLVKACAAEPGAGRVIVVDGGGSLRRALLGDQIAAQAADNGWAGLVIWGAVRDVEVLATLPLGIQAIGQCPLKTDKRGEGQRGIPLHFGGTWIAAGEWVYADANGVLISPDDLLAGSVES